jgi:hypothetical protein
MIELPRISLCNKCLIQTENINPSLNSWLWHHQIHRYVDLKFALSFEYVLNLRGEMGYTFCLLATGSNVLIYSLGNKLPLSGLLSLRLKLYMPLCAFNTQRSAGKWGREGEHFLALCPPSNICYISPDLFLVQTWGIQQTSFHYHSKCHFAGQHPASRCSFAEYCNEISQTPHAVCHTD